ncbi:MAG: MFS transporter permease [Gracilibacter sp. BRH_c7a]|nr:MAG: MFS transporter permease [Gracilibacter sp. BRH_c7a]
MISENQELSSVENQPKLTRGLLFLLAITSGISVANLYYIQPLLADIAQDFHVTAGEIGRIATVSQLGYALGLLLFIPLGDIRERKSLIFSLIGVVIIALVGVALSRNIIMLGIACFIFSLTTVIPQLILPLTAQLAEPKERGQALGIVMSGLSTGILLARTVSGVIGDIFGWRIMYWIAAGLMLILAVILKFFLPECKPASSIRVTYGQLLKSLWTLFVELPELRKAALFGAMIFGSFGAFWSTLAFFLQEPPYYFTAQIVGLFGLVGIVGILYTPLAGRIVDKKTPEFVGLVSGIITLIAFIILWQLGSNLWGLILGVIIFDIGTRGGQISNQARVYSLIPEARNRLNTVYMVSYFLGGSLGTYLGSTAWSILKWDGVFLVGSIMISIGVLSFLPALNKKGYEVTSK